MIMVNIDYIYKNLICEFTHWDICLTGLINHEGEKWYCEIGEDCQDSEDEDEIQEYKIYPVDWNDECEEYLKDYRVAYKHWFHEGNPRCSYDGWPLKWFSEKWPDENPIKNNINDKPR